MNVPRDFPPLTFFSQPLPGELIYSIIARNHYLSANYDSRVTIGYFFGERDAYISGEFPARLDTLSERTDIPIQTLLSEHTLLNFYRPFIDPHRLQRAADMMMSPSTQNITHTLGIQAGLLHFQNHHRRCALCAMEDIEQFGIAYSHVEHHLPGVYACTKHHCLLTGIPRPRKRLSIDFQGINLAPSHLTTPLLQLAHWCVESFRAPASIDPTKRITAYRYALAEHDLLTAAGNLRSNALNQALQSHWGDLLGFAPFTQFIEWMKSNQYPRGLLYKPNQQFHPVKHFLLLDFLFGSWKKFEESFDVQPLNKKPTITPVSTHDTAARDALVLSHLRQHNGVLRHAAATTSVSVQTVKAIALRHGLSIRSRTQKIFHQTKRSIWRGLFLGNSTEIIAKKHGLSVAAIEQILRSEPLLVNHRKQLRMARDRKHHRELWQTLYSQCANRGRKHLKNLAPSSYVWLYRHDREWLALHLPNSLPAHRPPRINVKIDHSACN